MALGLIVLRVVVDGILERRKQAVGHRAGSCGASDIRLPYQALVVFDVEEHEARLVALRDGDRTAWRFRDNVAGPAGKLACSVRSS